MEKRILLKSLALTILSYFYYVGGIFLQVELHLRTAYITKLIGLIAYPIIFFPFSILYFLFLIISFRWAIKKVSVKMKDAILVFLASVVLFGIWIWLIWYDIVLIIYESEFEYRTNSTIFFKYGHDFNVTASLIMVGFAFFFCFVWLMLAKSLMSYKSSMEEVSSSPKF